MLFRWSPYRFNVESSCHRPSFTGSFDTLRVFIYISLSLGLSCWGRGHTRSSCPVWCCNTLHISMTSYNHEANIYLQIILGMLNLFGFGYQSPKPWGQGLHWQGWCMRLMVQKFRYLFCSSLLFALYWIIFSLEKCRACFSWMSCIDPGLTDICLKIPDLCSQLPSFHYIYI